MLVELDITDLAIIERSTIRFEAGLNALTGETGAGKSILLDALGAVLGQRVSSDIVRTGKSAARVEALFEIPASGEAAIMALLDEFGIEHEPGELLILSRDIQASGRSTGRTHGRSTTLAQLHAVRSLLVDIHGQSDHLSILKPAEQRNILDRYGGLEAERTGIRDLVREFREVRAALEDVSRGSREREQRLDLLRFQIGEIDEVALSS